VQTSIKVSLFIAVAVAVSISPGIAEAVKDSASMISSVSSTLLGFVIAAAAIIVAVLDRPFMQNLNKTGHLNRVWKQLVNSGMLMMLALVACLLTQLVSKKYALYVSAFSFGFLAVALIELVACSNKLMKVMGKL
jgi:hypothetical protein